MLRKQSWFLLLSFIFFSFSLFATGIKHVIVVSVDGLRPDAISESNSPVIASLKKNGVWASHAQTIVPSITLPSHTSMLTGRSVEVHGVTWNEYDESKKNAVKVPTCLEVATQHGRSAAMFVGKEKFKHLQSLNGQVYFSWPATEADGISNAVLAYEREKGLPELLFIHYPDTDVAGHREGWMTPSYLAALKKVDTDLAGVVGLMQKSRYRDNTVIILTADHGGKDKSHSADIPEDRNIPWIANGASIASGLTYDQPIITYDTAATALSLLGVPVPAQWEGKAVTLPMKARVRG